MPLEDEAHVYVPFFRAIPLPPHLASAMHLFLCQDDERGVSARSELTIGFAVGAVDFRKDQKLSGFGAALEVGANEWSIDAGGF